MDEQQPEFAEPAHPVGPEIDDTQNPTSATPDEQMSGSGERPRAGREMLVQLQQMIDTLATSAGPVMREVAAKAAELAAVAGEKAGPVAHKAAAMTESVGQRVAARSKEIAADLRRPGEPSGEQQADQPVGDEPSWERESGAPAAGEVPSSEERGEMG